MEMSVYKLNHSMTIEGGLKWLGWIVALSLLTFVVGCGCDDSVAWTEEVKLSGGSVLNVRQIRQGHRIGDISMPSYITTRTILKIPQSQGPSLVWSGDYLYPLVLERDPSTRDFLIVATTQHGDAWKAMGSPRQPYWQFHYQNGQWTREPVSEFLWNYPANILLTGPEENYRGVVTLSKKRDLNGDEQLPYQHTAIHRDSYWGDTRWHYQK